MTCPSVQENLSFYISGDLDFTTEEAVEEHLDGCAECRVALDRERFWMETVKAEQSEIPLDFLSQCRQELRESIGVVHEAKDPLWLRCIDSLGLRPSAWSLRIAMASLLVCLGFGLSRLMERNGLPGMDSSDFGSEMGMNPVKARIRYIAPAADQQVQIVVDELREHVITGDLNTASPEARAECGKGPH